MIYEEAKIAAIMTAPRCEPVFARNCIDRALRALGIHLTVSGGVFYGQCMQAMLEKLIAQGIDLAVTVDFDSIFTANQLKRLLTYVMTVDEIDAITGMQVRRGKKAMLGTIPGGEIIDNETRQVIWDGNPILGTTAHFGLTVLDLHKLAPMPKPWFASKPCEDGTWGDDKVDDDVWFWLRWKEAGNTVYFDPGVRLGHLEEMVVVHDQHMQPQHIYPQQWETDYASSVA